MKYNELERELRKIGCYPTGDQQGGHPLWYSPLTLKTFQMSNHGKEEGPRGTLRKISLDSGLTKQLLLL